MHEARLSLASEHGRTHVGSFGAYHSLQDRVRIIQSIAKARSGSTGPARQMIRDRPTSHNGESRQGVRELLTKLQAARCQHVMCTLHHDNSTIHDYEPHDVVHNTEPRDRSLVCSLLTSFTSSIYSTRFPEICLRLQECRRSGLSAFSDPNESG